MVIKVPLEGLNRRKSRGKWYVSIRATGETLIKGFVGTKEQLEKKMRGHDFIAQYLAASNRKLDDVYADGTLGNLIQWFQAECPRWKKLSDASREDYEKSFTYLSEQKHPTAGRVYDFPASYITQPGVYQMRNKAAKDKWERFADKLVSHLSTIFKEAIKVGKVPQNPAGGVEKLHSADPNANHEWTEQEVQTAIWLAPDHLVTPMILARYQGFRGQTGNALTWKDYIPDQRTGRAFSIVIRKNAEPAWFPCEPETRAHLDALDKKSVRICLSSDGLPWKSEKVMQGAVSDYLATLKQAELIRPGCTLHGLRVTFAAAIRRKGFDTGIVADALGDRSKKMGEHYTRHVEKELGRLAVFEGKNGVQK